MDIHKPKPWHGWREFLREYAIVVVGVLTALATEQAVEWLHWRHVVSAERQALGEEVTGLWDSMTNRVDLQDCVDRRLAELQLVFERHDANQPLGLTAPIGRPSIQTATVSTLEMATADQSLSHMPLAEKQAYFGVFGTYELFQRMASEERGSWRALQPLNHPQSLSAADWAELRKNYDQALDSNAVMKANLVSGPPGAWLTAFTPFPKRKIASDLRGLPYVQQLCRSALSGSHASAP